MCLSGKPFLIKRDESFYLYAFDEVLRSTSGIMSLSVRALKGYLARVVSSWDLWSLQHSCFLKHSANLTFDDAGFLRE